MLLFCLFYCSADAISGPLQWILSHSIHIWILSIHWKLHKTFFLLLNSSPTTRSMHMNWIERQNVITHDCATFNRNNITNGINFVNVRDETLSSDMHDLVLSTGISVSCLNDSARGKISHDNRNSRTYYYNWK